MTQRELDRAVANALGEDLHHIHQRGFSLVYPDHDNFDPDCDCQEPQVLDWDTPFQGGAVQSFFDAA